MWITTGSWDQEESVMAITVVSAAAVSWLTPNAPDTTDTPTPTPTPARP